MIAWTDEALATLPVRDGVRQRGLTPTRLETFCDATFAFAVTVLVISSGVPASYHDLVAALRDVPAFAGSFAVIVSFWLAHRTWGHRYGLEDMTSTLLSFVVLFVMLVYVYPLKMMFSAFASFASGGRLPSSFSLSGPDELIGIFVLYGLGFAAQTGTLALLYVHVLRVAELRLDPLERLLTRQKAISLAMLGGTGLVSALFALVMPTRVAVYAGFVFFTMPITAPWLAIRHARAIEKLRASA
jgi:uncharacterized membrane protein